MTTWTPKSQQSETWAARSELAIRIFSPAVFSHAFHNGLRVFAISGAPLAGATWAARTKVAETWTPE